jgi:hypothetical protein
MNISKKIMLFSFVMCSLSGVVVSSHNANNTRTIFFVEVDIRQAERKGDLIKKLNDRQVASLIKNGMSADEAEKKVKNDVDRARLLADIENYKELAKQLKNKNASQFVDDLRKASVANGQLLVENMEKVARSIGITNPKSQRGLSNLRLALEGYDRNLRIYTEDFPF